jgi:hypothetical protein
LERAVREGRTLVTFDKGFGARVFHLRERAPVEGIVFFRLDRVDVAFVSAVLIRIATGADLRAAGYFTVIDDERVRQRPLPKLSPDASG